MLADRSNDVQQGKFAVELHLPAEAKHALLDFIGQEIPFWRDHPDRPDKNGETRLTEFLCDHLNSAAYGSSNWSHVQFRTETGDETKGGRSIDFTVKPKAAVIFIENRRHTQFDALFPIECKRLPTPSDKRRDEREYVFTNPGTTGGIQRFKFGYHGASHNFGAMIAYVQEKDFSHWHGKINDWIMELSKESDSEWGEEDLLNLINEDSEMQKCILNSTHIRTDESDKIDLRHLWISMN